MAATSGVAFPAMPARLPTENMAVPDTTRPTEAPKAGAKPRARLSFFFVILKVLPRG